MAGFEQHALLFIQIHKDRWRIRNLFCEIWPEHLHVHVRSRMTSQTVPGWIAGNLLRYIFTPTPPFLTAKKKKKKRFLLRQFFPRDAPSLNSFNYNLNTSIVASSSQTSIVIAPTYPNNLHFLQAALSFILVIRKYRMRFIGHGIILFNYTQKINGLDIADTQAMMK